MSTIVTRSGKGSSLTNNEVDANFTNLNDDKLQSGNTAAELTVTTLKFGSDARTMDAYTTSVDTALVQMATAITNTNTRYVAEHAFE